MNPFLDDSFHIRWTELKPENVVPDITLALERAEAKMEAIRSTETEELTFKKVVVEGYQAMEELHEAWGIVSHLDSVRNSDALREAHNEMLPKVTAFDVKMLLDQKLWSNVKTFSESEEAAALQGQDKRLLEELVAEFRNELKYCRVVIIGFQKIDKEQSFLKL